VPHAAVAAEVISRLMLIVISRRRSPSTVNFATCSRSLSISVSERSLILVDGLTPVATQIAFARVGRCVDRLQRDDRVLVVRDVDDSSARHSSRNLIRSCKNESQHQPCQKFEPDPPRS